MDSFHIRLHVQSDKPFLRELFEEAALSTYPELRERGRISLRDRIDEIFHAYYTHDEKVIAVAQSASGERLGMLWMQPSIHPVTELADFLVINVTVAPTYRGRGIGKRLIEYGRAFAEARGVRRLRLFVNVDNAPARGLYRTLGFKDQTCEMAWAF